MEMFNYKESSFELFNEGVEGVIEATKRTMEGIKDRKSYEELLKGLNETVAGIIVNNTPFAQKYEEEGAKVLKNPMVLKNENAIAQFNAFIAQVIYATIPMSASAKWGEEFMEVRQAGWGETARFLVSSNDLFQINEIAEGIVWGNLQPIYNNEVTVNASPIQVGTKVNFYAVASGNFDWGNFGLRAAVSFNSCTMIRAINALTSATTELGAAYTQAGISADTWTTMAQRISAANGGADVYALGTIGALGKAIPNTVGLQYGLGKEVMDKGYLDKYMGVRLIPLDNAIVPGTLNSSAKLLLADDRIYLLPLGHERPIKVLYEGDSIEVTRDALRSTDKTYAVNVTYRIGVAAVVGNKFGVITLE